MTESIYSIFLCSAGVFCGILLGNGNCVHLPKVEKQLLLGIVPGKNIILKNCQSKSRLFINLGCG